jgi:aminoglycoside phosphotransferase (APT) family kinase protein
MSGRPAPVGAERLAAACRRHLGVEGAVTDLRRHSGGASRETWSFTFTPVGAGAGPVQRLVLRRDPTRTTLGADRATEYRLLAAVGAAGVPVPRVRFLLEGDDDLGDGFVMDHVDGETIPRRILRDEPFAAVRPRLAAQCGRIAAAIHAVALETLPALEVLDAATQLERHRSLLDALGDPHPAFELGLAWLAEHLPAPTPARLVHGDFRNGNFVVGPEGIRAVLDWELAHLGDPTEDLGWLCVRSWRFGRDDRPAGGFGSRAELLDAYAAAGGREVGEADLHAWEVMGTLRWGLICQLQCQAHRQGLLRSVELAALGRRVAEQEWDLLTLIEAGAGPGRRRPPGSGPAAPPEPAAGAASPGAHPPGVMHDPPSAAELVGAVRELLERDVLEATEGRLRFHVRVAVNVLSMVERELTGDPAATAGLLARLGALTADLDGADVPARLAALAGAVRTGRIAPDDPVLRAFVTDLVRAKLAVSNPGYAGPTGPTDSTGPIEPTTDPSEA